MEAPFVPGSTGEAADTGGKSDFGAPKLVRPPSFDPDKRGGTAGTAEKSDFRSSARGKPPSLDPGSPDKAVGAAALRYPARGRTHLRGRDAVSQANPGADFVPKHGRVAAAEGAVRLRHRLPPPGRGDEALRVRAHADVHLDLVDVRHDGARLGQAVQARRAVVADADRPRPFLGVHLLQDGPLLLHGAAGGRPGAVARWRAERRPWLAVGGGGGGVGAANKGGG